MIDLSYIIPVMKARNMKTIAITYKGKEYKIPTPFDQCYFGSEPTKEITIGNRFNDQSSAICKATSFCSCDI